MKVITGLPDTNWPRVEAAARAAEAAGFDGINSHETAHDPFLPVAVAARVTERVELGTGIAVAFPRSPMVVAQTAWDLHVESGGRFHLGLGSQVKGHNERRFSVAWVPPAPRLRDYVEALRAIWACWRRGDSKLDYRGAHYQFTLMTPEFSPAPNDLPPIPVSIAAVGPVMMRTAGRVCDGVRLHGFATRRYLEQVALPEIHRGLDEAGRARADFEVIGGCFVATGPNEERIRKAMDAARYRVAFYGSTRSYRPVLEQHGLNDLGDKLHHLSVTGRWNEMADEVSDDVLELFTAIGPYDALPRKIEALLGGIADTIRLDLPEDLEPERRRALVAEIQRLPEARSQERRAAG